jgi:predicted transcriptional regulator
MEPTPLTDADRVRAALTQLGLSQRGAAKVLGISDRMVRHYCANTAPVPAAIFLALERLADIRECPYCKESRL